MGLKFNKLEAVEFGDIVATPAMTMELRLRIQNCKFGTAEETEESIKTIARAFEKSDLDGAITNFMKNEMALLDLQKLQAYLYGGDSALELINKQLDKAMEGINE